MGSATCPSERPGGTVLGVGALDTLTYPLAGPRHGPVPAASWCLWTLRFLVCDMGLRTAPAFGQATAQRGLALSLPPQSLPWPLLGRVWMTSSRPRLWVGLAEPHAGATGSRLSNAQTARRWRGAGEGAPAVCPRGFRAAATLRLGPTARSCPPSVARHLLLTSRGPAPASQPAGPACPPWPWCRGRPNKGP